MRLVMMGTGPFAVPTFRALFDTSHDVVALVTQPRRPTRGKRDTIATPMRDEAESRELPILDPADLNTDEAQSALAEYAADLFVVADYGQILSRETLGLARLGGVNLHGSLLPKYRGAAPINWALYHGETETGVSVIHMTPKLDAGPVLAQARTPVDPDEDAVRLEVRLSELGAPLVCETIDALANDSTTTIPQDATQATRARRLRKSDGELDWSRSAIELKNQVRALVPWPMCHTYWHRAQDEPLRLILGQVSLATHTSTAAPGTVVDVARDRLVVATSDSQTGLELHALQPAGKRMLSIEDFLRGYPVPVGTRFGRIEG